MQQPRRPGFALSRYARGLESIGHAMTGPGQADRIAGSPLGPVRPGSQQERAAAAGDRLLFAYDSSDISPNGQQSLVRQSGWLKRYPNITVLIEGHADERGTSD